MNKFIVSAVSFSLSLLVLVGCTPQQDRWKYHSGQFEEKKGEADKLIDQVGDGKPSANIDYMEYVSDEIFINPIAVRERVEDTDLILNSTLSYNARGEISIDEIASDLSYMSGVKITLAPEIVIGARQVAPEYEVQKGQDSPEKLQGTSGGDGDRDFKLTMRPSWKKATLRNILNQLSTNLNVSWSYDKDAELIHMYRYRSQSYKFHVPSEKVKHTAQITNDSGGDSGSISGSAIKSSIAFDTDFWSKIGTSIESYLSRNGTHSVNKDLYEITVFDTDEVHSTINKYVRETNDEQLVNILYDVQIITLQSEDEDLLNLNYNAVYEGATKSLAFGTPRPDASGLGSLVGGITGTESKWNGSQLFVDALSRYGKTHVFDRFQRVQINNMPTTHLVSLSEDYLKERAGNAEEGVISETASLTPLITGLSLSLRGHVVNDSKIMLTTALDRKTQQGDFKDVPLGDGRSLQSASVVAEGGFLTSLIHSGETLIVSGYIQNQRSLESSGTAGSEAYWSGGGRDNAGQRRVILFMITPRVMGNT